MTLNFKKSMKNKIKICCWNIHEIKSQDLFIPGYRLLKQKIRKKTHRGPKIGGGIAVFVKEELCDSAHVVPNSNEDSICIKLGEKSKMDREKDIFFGS